VCVCVYVTQWVSVIFRGAHSQELVEFHKNWSELEVNRCFLRSPSWFYLEWLGRVVEGICIYTMGNKTDQWITRNILSKCMESDILFKNGNCKGRKSTTYEVLGNRLLSRIIAFVNNTDGYISVNDIVIDQIVSYVFVSCWRNSVRTVGRYFNIRP
jgi:uridine phosphorylase